MTDTKPAIVQLRPAGEGRADATRLEVAKISYGAGNGPTGQSCRLIFKDERGNMIFEVDMDSSQLDREVASAIYAAVWRDPEIHMTTCSGCGDSINTDDPDEDIICDDELGWFHHRCYAPG